MKIFSQFGVTEEIENESVLEALQISLLLAPLVAYILANIQLFVTQPKKDTTTADFEMRDRTLSRGRENSGGVAGTYWVSSETAVRENDSSIHNLLDDDECSRIWRDGVWSW